MNNINTNQANVKSCFIFAAGDFFGLRQKPEAGDFIIAADAGYLTCLNNQITPHLLTGDFDSLHLPENFLPETAFSVPVLRLPVEKDDTDTLFAIREGLAQNCQNFYLYGASGGARMDHTLANLQSLLFIRRHRARGWLYDRNFIWTAIENETLRIPRTVEHGLVSVFCLGNRAEGVEETGLQYPLNNSVLTPDFPVGVSNHFQDEEAVIRVRHGALLVGWELPDNII